MRRVILAIVGTTAALVMVLSFKTHGTASVTAPPAAVSSTGTSSGSTTSSSSSTASTSTGTKTVTGNAVDTQYGPVQVRVTVTNGKVTSATAVDYPQNSPRDQEINAYAIPTLNQEAAQTGTANIDMVSGATYTSEGYIRSLQSALNQA